MRERARAVLKQVAPTLYWKRRLRYLRAIAHEPELALLPALCHGGEVCVDVGAAGGAVAIRLADLGKEVHAFEPRPEAARDLRSLARYSNLPIVVHETALSDHSGTETIRVPGNDSGRSTIEEANGLEDQDASCVKRVIVQVQQLDDLGLRNVCFVKIDAEGHELAVLRGARGVIERDRPSVLIEAEERHRTGAVASIRAFFDACGYAGYFVLDGQLVPLADFVLETHQASANIGDPGDGWARRGTYVNNFIFLAPGEDTQLSRQILESLPQTS
jgi:FkbM family methyltransferase